MIDTTNQRYHRAKRSGKHHALITFGILFFAHPPAGLPAAGDIPAGAPEQLGLSQGDKLVAGIQAVPGQIRHLLQEAEHLATSVTALLILLSITLLLAWHIKQLRRTVLKLRESEQKVRELSQLFQIVLDGIPDSLTLISKEMKVVWTNKNAGNYFTDDLGTLPRQSCCNLLYNRASICDNCPAINAFHTGKSEESIISTPDDRTLEVKAFPVRGDDQQVKYVIMLACDITEKNRLLEEMIRSRRLVALGELAAGVAHEINNPNALILLNAALMKKACGEAAPILQRYYEENGDLQLGGLSVSEMCCEMPQLFNEMFESAERIKRIVNDLTYFARAGDPDLREAIDLNQGVEAAIRLIGSVIKTSTNHLTVDLTEGMPHFSGNLQRIEQVVVNLIMNACQALPDKEKGIHIATSFNPERRACILTVRDEGVGISEEIMPHITDPFCTTKRQSGGTGLGLSISMRIVKNYGGSLKFLSEVNKGTTVYLQLPAAQEAIEL